MAVRIVINIVLVCAVFLTLSCKDSAYADEQSYKRTIENYTIPDVVLIDQNGAKIHFREMMQSNKPIVVDFIFGTCTTICSVLSASFADLQNKIGVESGKVQLVSISIDPENDTPKIMKEYLKRYRAKPGWDFLTGSRKDIDRVMSAFDAYMPNKISHQPLILLRTPADGKWTRTFGLMSSSEFINECHEMGIK